MLTVTAESYFKELVCIYRITDINPLWPTLQPCVGSLPCAGFSLQHPLHDEGAAPLPLVLPP